MTNKGKFLWCLFEGRSVGSRWLKKNEKRKKKIRWQHRTVAYLSEGSCWLSYISLQNAKAWQFLGGGVLADAATLAGQLHTIGMAWTRGLGRAPMGLCQAGQGFSIRSIKKRSYFFCPSVVSEKGQSFGNPKGCYRILLRLAIICDYLSSI